MITNRHQSSLLMGHWKYHTLKWRLICYLIMGKRRKKNSYRIRYTNKHFISQKKNLNEVGVSLIAIPSANATEQPLPLQRKWEALFYKHSRWDKKAIGGIHQSTFAFQTRTVVYTKISLHGIVGYSCHPSRWAK